MADKEFYYEPDCGDDIQLIVANNYVGEIESFTHNFDKMMLLVKHDTHLYGVNVLDKEGFEDLPCPDSWISPFFDEGRISHDGYSWLALHNFVKKQQISRFTSGKEICNQI